MKKQFFVFIILFSFSIFNCKNNDSASFGSGIAEQDTIFYPIGNFIRNELISLDSMPLAVIKYSTQKQVTDTTIIDKEDFKKIAALFMTPDIGSSELKSQYEETSFIDATLGMMTLTYTAKNETMLIRRADVLLKQDNTGVNTIYIEKMLPNKDSAVVQKLLWTAGRNCQVTSIVQRKGQPEVILLERYVWDDREF